MRRLPMGHTDGPRNPKNRMHTTARLGSTGPLPAAVHTRVIAMGFGLVPCGPRRYRPAPKTFKLSNDPKFEEKLIDVCGLYLDPSEKAIVLCLDELCEASH